jgi:hypothetical protein
MTSLPKNPAFTRNNKMILLIFNSNFAEVLQKKSFMKFASLTFLIFLLSFISTQAQEMEQKKEIKHKIALFFGFVHVPKAIENGESIKPEYLPTIGLDYFYELNQKWELGVVLDFELGKYAVDFGGENIPREFALVTGVVAYYSIVGGWGIFAGPGVEFERNKNLFILKTGTEYAFKLEKDWGWHFGFSYDFKKEYSSYFFGVGVSKGF